MTERISFPTLDSARLRALRLGAFTLEERIGVGGMSEVWRARHEESGAQVAVKLIGGSISSRDTQRAATDALRQEVMLLSRLGHPGILRVLEFGTVEPEESERSSGALPSGSPYLVTPWARLGSLDKAPLPTDWAALHATLRALLLALAHAHARGVVHRDLKPANVLLIGDPTRGPVRPVLSDFGIAFALARAQRDTSRSPGDAMTVGSGAQGTAPPLASHNDQLGTPAYMAPEQILGTALSQGPATDLYALGCVAYRLALGRAPFTGPTEEVLRAHVLLPAPPLRAAIPVPAGFSEWVAVLLAKDPEQRFPSAAFARHALDEVAGRVSWVPAERPSLFPPSEPNLGARDAVTAPRDVRNLIRSSRPPRNSIRPEAPRARISLFPPMPPPSNWRALESLTDHDPIDAHEAIGSEPRASLPEFELSGSGLGLFGLRRLDVVGRERERDRLYAELLAVHAEGRARAVVLRGAIGMGTTRLGEWLLEVASELDVGRPLDVAAGEARVRGDAVVELLHVLLGTRGASPEQTEARVAAWTRDAALSSGEGQDLLAVLHRTHDRFRSPTERHAAVLRALGAAAERVPLVVFLDDAAVDLDCLALVVAALRMEEPLSVLFVISVSDELLEPASPNGEARAAALARVLGAPRAQEIVLGPLAPDEQSELVQRLLELSAPLSREVLERSEGRPLFAFQLVGDWVARGLLVPGVFGFTLKEGAQVDVPDGIHELLRRCLVDAHTGIAARTSVADADQALIGLELAALLSPAPLNKEWHAVLDAAGVRAAQAVPDLAARGLVRPSRDRLVIAHRMLRETLFRRAKEAGRFVAHHRVIASVLAELDVDPSRLASHYLAAGDLEQALAPLLASAERRCARSDTAGALEALRLHGEALDQLLVSPSDARRIRGRLLRAEVLGHDSSLDEAERLLDETETGLAERAADEEGRALGARLSWMRGVFAQKRGQAQSALVHFQHAWAVLEALPPDAPDRPLLARAVFGVAEAAKLMGDIKRASEAYAVVSKLVDPSHRLVPLVLTGLSDLESRGGNLERARELGQQSLELLEARGARHDAAIARNALGDIERKRGDLVQAEAHYLAASEQLAELGSGDLAIMQMNLALLAVHRGDWALAKGELDVAELALTAQTRGGYASFVAIMRLPGLAVAGDEAAMSTILAREEGFLANVFDPDLDWCLERALALSTALSPTLRTRLEALVSAQKRHRPA